MSQQHDAASESVLTSRLNKSAAGAAPCAFNAQHDEQQHLAPVAAAEHRLGGLGAPPELHWVRSPPYVAIRDPHGRITSMAVTMST